MKKYEKLDAFFERVKNLGFWQRIFGWKPVQHLSYEAFEEYKSLITLASSNEEQIAAHSNKIDLLNNDNSYIKAESIKLQNSLDVTAAKLTSVETALSAKNGALASREEAVKQSDKKIIEHQSQLKFLEETLASVKVALSRAETTLATKEENIKQSERKGVEQHVELQSLKENIRSLQESIAALNKENAIFKKTEADRAQLYEGKISTFNAITERIQNEREAEKQKNLEEEIQRLTAMKETWANHQTGVQEVIKGICQKHTIQYIDQVPFKGSPDNTIKICDEFVIFDAKSPSSDDFGNFPSYIRQQTESVKKYVKQENVRKDVFLVIPSNTVEVIQQFSYNLADYNVYVVTLDALEPIMLCLKRIEDYEFLDQLTPEERENICRIISKFAHITKRKIQIDQFFTREFISILSKCETGLPSEILAKVNEYEKAEKMNPPQEKRAKQISLKDLDSESEKIRKNIELLIPPTEQAFSITEL